jgi:phosphoribosyl 1,2-cyclic phosphate phosphodiesterase
MRVPGRVTFLGTGTSQGVPVIACECPVCQSTDPRDTRLRPSIYVDVPGHASLLVDTTPDFRQQALRYGIRRLDAVLFTHAHADHILGFDELRTFNARQGGPIPCYANGFCLDILKRTFYYVFDGVPRLGGGVPQVDVHEIGSEPFTVAGIRVMPVPLWHGRMPILGYRFGNFAYLTDCNRIPDESWERVAGVDTLVIDGLRDEPHTTHFTVAEAIDAIARIAPRRAYLTHMTHDLGYAATNARLPPGVELAYDGLRLDIEVDAGGGDGGNGFTNGATK